MYTLTKYVRNALLTPKMLSSFFNRTKNHEAFLWVTLGPLTVVELMYHLSTHSIIRYSVVLVPPRLLLLVVLLHLLFCIFHLTIPDPIPVTVCCSERVSVFPTASALYVYIYFLLFFILVFWLNHSLRAIIFHLTDVHGIRRFTLDLPLMILSSTYSPDMYSVSCVKCVQFFALYIDLK